MTSSNFFSNFKNCFDVYYLFISRCVSNGLCSEMLNTGSSSVSRQPIRVYSIIRDPIARALLHSPRPSVNQTQLRAEFY